MAPSGQLLLDLGDLFTKGLAPGPGEPRRLRFPSVVARCLLHPDEGRGDLLADGRDPELSRLIGERPPPRTRSYPGADAVLDEASLRASGAGRYTGWQAVTYGADRELLGDHPTRENVEALVHKALILLRPSGGCELELVLVLDSGAKARVLADYASRPAQRIVFSASRLGAAEERRVDVLVRSRVLDAAACAVAALPETLRPEQVGNVALLDIGDRRTKLAVLSASGCERQVELEGLGVRDAVRTVLRDAGEHGVMEDEFAVIRALERSRGAVMNVAGRRYVIGPARERALEALAQELSRSVRRTLLDFYARSVDPCRTLAIAGGGAVLAGARVAARLASSGLGIETTWLAPDASFHSLTGALELCRTDRPR